MVTKGKYKGASNQSLSSSSESQLLQYLIEYNPSVVSFGQYAKTRVDLFGSSSRHATPEGQKLRTKIRNRLEYHKSQPRLLRENW